jgi:hypothetical protein
MTTAEARRDNTEVQSPCGTCRLSTFERRCLIKRLGECHEAIQHLLTGCESLRWRGGMASICAVLEGAELALAEAEGLVSIGEGETQGQL